mgnify:CR=1 FL=1
MAYCGHCGNRVDRPARFCPACGASVDSAPVASVPVPAASSAVPTASIPAPAVPAPSVPPSIPAAPVAPSVYAAPAAPQPAPTAPLPALPIPAPAAYQATDATAVLAPPRKSSKKLIAVLCALLATILVAAWHSSSPTSPPSKRCWASSPPIRWSSPSTRSTRCPLCAAPNTNSEPTAALTTPLTRGCLACIRWGKTTNDSSASVTIKTDEQATTSLGTKAHSPGKTFGMMTTPTTSTTRPTNMKMT